MRLRQLLGKWAELGKFAKRSNSVVHGHHRHDLGYFGYLRRGPRDPACVCLPVTPACTRDAYAGASREPRRRLELIDSSHKQTTLGVTGVVAMFGKLIVAEDSPRNDVRSHMKASSVGCA